MSYVTEALETMKVCLVGCDKAKSEAEKTRCQSICKDQAQGILKPPHTIPASEYVDGLLADGQIIQAIIVVALSPELSFDYILGYYQAHPEQSIPSDLHAILTQPVDAVLAGIFDSITLMRSIVVTQVLSPSYTFYLTRGTKGADKELLVRGVAEAVVTTAFDVPGALAPARVKGKKGAVGFVFSPAGQQAVVHATMAQLKPLAPTPTGPRIPLTSIREDRKREAMFAKYLSRDLSAALARGR